MSEQVPSITPGEIVESVRAAAHGVFSTMLNLPLDDKPAYEEAERDPPESCDGLAAVVGIGGSWTGTGRITCSSLFACKLAEGLLMAPYEGINEDVLDAVAEVANMIIGNVKTNFEEKLGPLGLSVPTVIFGRNYKTRSIGVKTWVVVPFESAGQGMEVRFCLMPSRQQTHAAPRAEVLQAT
jgi:chemotaxis protein CheX